MEKTLKEKNKLRMKCLKMAVNESARRFLSPFYLVGSYIEKEGNARDIDILMAVTNDRYERLFESIENPNYDKIFHFRKKEKQWIEQYVNDMDIDFKVVTWNGLIASKGKKIKLDDVQEFPE